MKRVTVLGATGSVGRRALELVGRFPEQFRIEGLAAKGSNPEMVAAFRGETFAQFLKTRRVPGAR